MPEEWLVLVNVRERRDKRKIDSGSRKEDGVGERRGR